MTVPPKQRPIQRSLRNLPADLMSMAGSMAEEIEQRWPFTVARLQLELSGCVVHPHLRPAIGEAVTLGLSGIAAGAVDVRKIASIFALQERMMAIRLAGRRLIAFHPDRDIQFKTKQPRQFTDCIRAKVWATNGTLIGQIERLARPLTRQVLQCDGDNKRSSVLRRWPRLSYCGEHDYDSI